MPLVSVCIPTYNQVDYLRKCLQSVIDQDFTDYELIVSDDTPDDTVKQVVYDLLKDKAFRYVKNSPSLGSPANWNKAIAEAKGNYIKVMHHDDYFMYSYSLRSMVEHIQAQNADFLFCETKVWYPATDFCRVHAITPKLNNRLRKNIDFLFFKNCIGAPSATLYRNDPSICYDERLVWLVDVDFYITYIKAHTQFTFLNQPLVCTVHGTETQVTGKVINDRAIQVKEHVLVFIKNRKCSLDNASYTSFFDYLFRDLGVESYEELLDIVPAANQYEKFFRNIFLSLHKHVFLKRLRRRLYSNVMVNLLKLEQF